MYNSDAANQTQALARLIYLLARANSYTIGYLFGPKFGPTFLSAMLSPEVSGGCYGRYLLGTARQIIAGAPEMVEALNTEDWRESVVKPFLDFVQDQISQQISDDQIEELRKGLEVAAAQAERVLADGQGDGRSPLGDGLEVDVETLAKEPERLREVFSPRSLGLHPREVDKLEDALGIDLFGESDQSGTDQFAQAIFPHLLQVSTGPQDVKLPPLRKDSRVWQWAGVPAPSKEGAGDLESTFDWLFHLFKFTGQQEHRQELVRYLLARILRQEYGLNRGRKVVDPSSRSDEDGQITSESPLENCRDPAAEEEFQTAETRMLLEELLQLASPAQLEAVEIYRQAEDSGKSVADVCRSVGRDPNTVRNNLQAFQKKVKSKMAEP